MANCSNCGTEIKEGSKFCPSCGKESANKAEDLTAKLQDLNSTSDYTSEFSNEDIQANKVMALLSYIGILFLVPLLAAQESKYARFHANQGIILFIVGFILGIVSAIVSTILMFIPGVGEIVSSLISVAIGLIDFVFIILGIFNAVTGKAKELPLIGKFRILK